MRGFIPRCRFANDLARKRQQWYSRAIDRESPFTTRSMRPMRVFRLSLLVTVTVFLVSVSGTRAEYFGLIMEANRRAWALWEYSHLKYLDMLAIRFWGWGDEKQRPPMLQDVRSQILECRCIVSRKNGAGNMAWKGSPQAFVVDPVIWYFDPDSRVEKMSFAWWHLPLTD